MNKVMEDCLFYNAYAASNCPLKDPSIVAPFKLKRKVPANPAMVIVFPTNGVEEEMVKVFSPQRNRLAVVACRWLRLIFLSGLGTSKNILRNW